LQDHHFNDRRTKLCVLLQRVRPGLCNNPVLPSTGAAEPGNVTQSFPLQRTSRMQPRLDLVRVLTAGRTAWDLFVSFADITARTWGAPAEKNAQYAFFDAVVWQKSVFPRSQRYGKAKGSGAILTFLLVEAIPAKTPSYRSPDSLGAAIPSALTGCRHPGPNLCGLRRPRHTSTPISLVEMRVSCARHEVAP
jgi:hypothetical protein